MRHPNVVHFEQCFEDDGNVYMQLELCSNGVRPLSLLSLSLPPSLMPLLT